MKFNTVEIIAHIEKQLSVTSYHWPLLLAKYWSLARYVKLQVAHAPGMPGKFSPAADFKGNRELANPVCITARA